MFNLRFGARSAPASVARDTELGGIGVDLRLTAEQEQLVDAFSALFAKQSAPEAVRAAEPQGFDPDLWARVGEMGAVAMAVPAHAGGWDATMVDLALVAEQQGRFLAPVPIIESQVAARLLARLGSPQSQPALAAALEQSAIVTVALRPAVRGELSLVPAGLVADHVVARAGDRVVLVQPDERTAVENLGSMPVADLTADDVIELAAGPDACDAFERAIDEWLALTGAALVGVGARGLEIGVDYVKERHAWGVPIGSFRSIAHRLADSAAAIDGARLLAWEAAWAYGAEPDRAASLSAMAFAFAYESARDATYRSLHYHGGYGFMMETDIQLYYRRARAWALAYGDPTGVYRRVVDRRQGRLAR